MAVRNVRILLRRFHPLSLIVIGFSPAERAFFVRVAFLDGFWERRVFLEFGQYQLSLLLLRRVGEFPLSLKEELGRSRILRSLHSNGLRNQRVNSESTSSKGELNSARIKVPGFTSLSPIVNIINLL
ncbi:hypothetical protein AVEN_208828-1 [Araneus ventricosus]|uniref:Uncharacterized protein n=1 Tax=Araneus ventricosus TaxID=182803 RepID=A0A4Y2NXQ6_ARAVE|nr:hypothetical protein AVEN_208828-1 [Araneus ventricosus]